MVNEVADWFTTQNQLGYIEHIYTGYIQYIYKITWERGCFAQAMIKSTMLEIFYVIKSLEISL